jgi:hypothetical protein
MSENQKLDMLIENLKTFRADIESAKVEKNKIIDAAKASNGYILWDTKQSDAQLFADGTEAEIKKIALEDYAENKNKHPHDKVDIAMRKKFSIIEPARVLAWVKTNLADALIFDEKKVKNYATKIGAVDGTELTEEPIAQIASNL